MNGFQWRQNPNNGETWADLLSAANPPGPNSSTYVVVSNLPSQASVSPSCTLAVLDFPSFDSIPPVATVVVLKLQVGAYKVGAQAMTLASVGIRCGVNEVLLDVANFLQDTPTTELVEFQGSLFDSVPCTVNGLRAASGGFLIEMRGGAIGVPATPPFEARVYSLEAGVVWEVDVNITAVSPSAGLSAAMTDPVMIIGNKFFDTAGVTGAKLLCRYSRAVADFATVQAFFVSATEIRCDPPPWDMNSSSFEAGTVEVTLNGFAGSGINWTNALAVRFGDETSTSSSSVLTGGASSSSSSASTTGITTAFASSSSTGPASENGESSGSGADEVGLVALFVICGVCFFICIAAAAALFVFQQKRSKKHADEGPTSSALSDEDFAVHVGLVERQSDADYGHLDELHESSAEAEPPVNKQKATPYRSMPAPDTAPVRTRAPAYHNMDPADIERSKQERKVRAGAYHNQTPVQQQGGERQKRKESYGVMPVSNERRKDSYSVMPVSNESQPP